jgi:DNA-binding CsgD family transcriptional regulator
VGSAEDEKHLRPVERRILDLVRAGVRDADIANRFRRSPAYVRRVVELADLPRRELARSVEQLRPVERRVLRLLEEGARPADIAARFRRTPAYVMQVERLARHKLSAAVRGAGRRDE